MGGAGLCAAANLEALWLFGLQAHRPGLLNHAVRRGHIHGHRPPLSPTRVQFLEAAAFPVAHMLWKPSAAGDPRP